MSEERLHSQCWAIACLSLLQELKRSTIKWQRGLSKWEIGTESNLNDKQPLFLLFLWIVCVFYINVIVRIDIISISTPLHLKIAKISKERIPVYLVTNKQPSTQKYHWDQYEKTFYFLRYERHFRLRSLMNQLSTFCKFRPVLSDNSIFSACVG